VPGATIDREARVLTVSQSWLQTFMRCPQRALYELLDPRPGYNDATATGQAMHTHIELRLSGEPEGQARRSAESWLTAVVELDPEFRFVKVKTLATMLSHLNACIDGFERDVLPMIERGGRIEQHMTAPLAVRDGWEIQLEGRPDYIDPNGIVWDWKSSSSEYNAYETVEWNIQPTAYTYLATFTSAPERHEGFVYAIAIKPHGTVQFIDVDRHEGHWAWLGRIAEGALALLRALPEGPWPVDHTHHLCSQKWCPWWQECRGAVFDHAIESPVHLTTKGTIMENYDDDDPVQYEDQYEDRDDHRGPRAMADVRGPDNLPLPIGEVVTEDTMQGLAKLTRSLNLGTRDNNVHLGIELPFVVQPGWSWEKIAASAADAMFQAKAIVYEQLGVEFTTNENGVLMEVVRASLPGTTVERARDDGRGRPPSGPSRQGGGGERRPAQPQSFPDPTFMECPPHVDADLWASIQDNPGEWWDNRADKASGKVSSKYPDFRPKNGGQGVWITPFRRESARR
jgi:hypothetical protein